MITMNHDEEEPESSSRIQVHVTHCCARHGCKYGSSDCIVAAGKLKQRYPCEQCDFEEAERVDACCEDHSLLCSVSDTSLDACCVRCPEWGGEPQWH